MPPQSRGRGGNGVQTRRPLGAHSKSTPNLAQPPLEPFPTIPEPHPKPAITDSPTKSNSTPVKPSQDTKKNSSPTTKTAARSDRPDAVPLTKASLDGAQGSRPSPTFLTGAPSDPASSPDLDDFMNEHDFRSLREYGSSTSGSDEDEGHSTPEASGLLPPLPSNQKRPQYPLTSRSHSSLGLPHDHSRAHSVHSLAPPFYNRPPTPLPPSPSLTSLLRPLPFSALPSRHNSPESSDTEAPSTTPGGIGSSTAAVVAHSARTATTVPRASPNVPTYEYYGFVLYLGSTLLFAMYILWSYLPTPFLHQLGIYYYPNRWWSLAIPAWLVMVLVYIYVALAGYNTGYLTLKMRNLGCLVDEKGHIAVVDEKGKIVRQRKGGKSEGNESGVAANGTRLAAGAGVNNKGKGRDVNAEVTLRDEYGRLGIGKDVELPELDWKKLWNEGTDAVMDVPLGGVCEILYGDESDGDDEDDLGVYD